MQKQFNPSRLTMARLRRKLSKKELAAKVGLTPKSILNLEDGSKSPSDTTLDLIASALNFPLDFFSQADMDAPTPHNASFRSFSRMTSAQRDAALTSGGFAFSFATWLDERFNLPPVSVPDLTGTDPEAAADIVRSDWALGVIPIKNVIHLLESRGVKVFSLVEDTREVNAFSSWRNGETPFVFLNTVKSSESSRFDACHELGHLVLHRHGDPKGKEVEAEANAFASALLMPRPEMLAIGPSIRSISDVLTVKKRWNVSAMALVFRLHKLGVLSDWLYRSMCIELSSKGMRLQEVDSAERETSLILKKVFASLKASNFGLRDIAEELKLPAEELHKLVFGLVSVSLGVDNPVVKATPRRRGHLRLVH